MRALIFLIGSLFLISAQALEEGEGPSSQKAVSAAAGIIPKEFVKIQEELDQELEVAAFHGKKLKELVARVRGQISSAAGLADLKLLIFRMMQLQEGIKLNKTHKIPVQAACMKSLEILKELLDYFLREGDTATAAKISDEMENVSLKINFKIGFLNHVFKEIQTLNLIINAALAKDPGFLLLRYQTLLEEKTREEEENKKALEEFLKISLEEE